MPKRPGHDAEPTLRAAFVAGIALYATSLGMSRQEVLATAALPETAFADPDARVSYRHGLALWRALVARFPDQPLAVRFARQLPAHVHATVAYAARNARTLRDALHTVIRYQAVASSHMRLRLTGDGAVLLRHHPTVEAVPVVMEAVAAQLVAELQAVAGRQLRVCAELRHRAPAALEEYEAYFGEVRFERPRNAIVLDPEALDQPVPEADPDLYRALQARLDVALAELRPARGGAALAPVHAAIAAIAADGDYRREALARRVGMSVRSLQRLARACGTSVHELLDEHRQQYGCKLLANPALGVEEVAFLLGYSEERAFTRAFKRWTGQTPASYRRG